MNPELDDTVIIAELVVDETPNLPAVKAKPGALAVPGDFDATLGEMHRAYQDSWESQVRQLLREPLPESSPDDDLRTLHLMMLSARLERLLAEGEGRVLNAKLAGVL